jgi:hypothetical protein
MKGWKARRLSRKKKEQTKKSEKEGTKMPLI